MTAKELKALYNRFVRELGHPVKTANDIREWKAYLKKNS